MQASASLLTHMHSNIDYYIIYTHFLQYGILNKLINLYAAFLTINTIYHIANCAKSRDFFGI